MAREGAEITVLVPRLYCPAWLRRLLSKPPNYDHTVALVDIDGLTAIPIPYLGLPGQWFNRWSGLVVYWALRRTATRLHREHHFDTIYATELFLNGDAARRLAPRLGVPAACLAIGSDVNVMAKATPALARHFKCLVTQLKGMLACGEGLAEEIRVHRDQAPTLCVYGVVDLATFSPVEKTDEARRKLTLPTDRVLILYVGYLWTRKGLLDLIEAFEDVHTSHPNTCLVMCGAGDEESTIKSAAAKSSARDAILFLGGVEPNVVHRYMQASDIFVLPSHAEGMPNAVMEAMACGLPVVCTSVGGLTAALQNTEGADLVPPSDSKSLATAISAIVANPAKRLRMGSESLKLAQEQFGVRQNARRILNYLGSLDTSRERARTDSLSGS